jgi:hypothetical protein
VPPGYKDKAKPGYYAVGDRELIRKFGDLVLWKEIIRKAKADQVAAVVLVTGDIKEDWWLEKRGKKLGPRKELLNEIYTDAPCVQTFYMYDTASFLKHAKSRLNANVKDSSISQAKDLIAKSRKSRVVAEEDIAICRNILRPQLHHGRNYGSALVDLSIACRQLSLTLLSSADALTKSIAMYSLTAFMNTLGCRRKIGKIQWCYGLKIKWYLNPLLLRRLSRFRIIIASGLGPNLCAGVNGQRRCLSGYRRDCESFVVELHIPKGKFYREPTLDFE